MKESILVKKADKLAHGIYHITRNFPNEESFGLTSQIRRSALSIVLNIVEGYARNGDKSYKNFLLISYGSLKETKYLLHFALIEKYISQDEYKELISLAEEVGKMLWKTIEAVKKKV